MKPQLTRRQFLQGAGTVMTAITLTSLARSICFGSTGSQGVDTEPHALASGPVLTRAVLPPEIPLSLCFQRCPGI